MARDCEVIQRQHFCHHGGTICHPKLGYVTTGIHLEKDMSVPFGHTVATTVCLFEILCARN